MQQHFQRGIVGVVGLGKLHLHAARLAGCTGAVETQEHCLSMCRGNMAAIRARHDLLLRRHENAIPPELGTKFVDQAVPGCPGLRPDVVILNREQKKAYMVDVTCPNK